ncbi:MAG: tetratricopeptide repeat protein [Pseudomonadales bacterium]|nr:tetratricopeptide repeat protein [Pseudomonadales bacterium]
MSITNNQFTTISLSHFRARPSLKLSNSRPRHRPLSVTFYTFALIITAMLVSWSGSSHSAKVKDPLNVPHYVKDIAYGEILYDYYQQRYFSSITRTLVAQEHGTLTKHKDHAELLLGSLYVSYGLIDEAESIFNRLIDRTTEKESRDQAWFYLAALHYQRGNYDRTNHILNQQLKNLSRNLENERKILNAILLMRDKNFSQAVKELSAIPRTSRLNIYAKYNMAVAFASLGKGVKSTKLFDAILELPREDVEISALKDKSALALGINFLRQDKFDSAILTLNDIRLDSPFANPALFALGWAHLSKENYEKALTPWSELKQRDSIDRSVQEVYLHIPFVYEQLGALKTALDGYIEAKSIFNSEQIRIKKAIEVVNTDTWVDGLSPPLDYSIDPMSNLPNFKPEKKLASYYLYQFFASHRFNESYRNYRELQRLSLLIQRWQQNMPVFTDMLQLNQNRLAALTPHAKEVINQSIQSRLELTQNLNKLSPIQHAALSGNNIAATASLNELETKYRLDDVAALLQKHKDSTFFEKEKVQLNFLRGIWRWDISENSGERYWNIQKQTNAIQQQRQTLDERIKNLTLAHDNAEKRFAGFKGRFMVLNESLDSTLARVQLSLHKHQSYMQSIASEILEEQIDELEQLKSETLLSIAHLHDISYVIERRKKGLLPEEGTDLPTSSEPVMPKRRTILNIKSWWN